MWLFYLLTQAKSEFHSNNKQRKQNVWKKAGAKIAAQRNSSLAFM